MTHPAFILKTTKNGEYYATLTASNGQPIARTEIFKTKSAAENCIVSIQVNSQRAEIDDQTDPKTAS